MDWSILARGYLTLKKCFGAVNPGFADDRETWNDDQKEKNNNALYLIQCMAGSEFRQDIRDCETAKEAWATLEEINVSNSMINGILVLAYKRM